MNEKLRFSWGHILAFIAIIFVCYVTFMGAIYLYKGDYVKTGIAVGVTLILLLLIFIGAQFLKGTEAKFKTRIWRERILIFLSPVLIGTMMLPSLPFAHFWSIEHQEEEVKKQFLTSIEASKQMFKDYDAYTKERVELLRTDLYSVVENKDADHYTYTQFGFIDFNDQMQIDNRTKALEAQLNPTGYDSLKLMANQWIEKANRGASVWNVFLIGNVSAIKDAVTKWHRHLQDFSKKRFSLEGDGYVFDVNKKSLDAATGGLEKLTRMYESTSSDISWETMLSALLCYLFLLTPYLVQKRSTKSRERLFLPRKTHIDNKHDDDEDPDHGIIWNSKTEY